MLLTDKLLAELQKRLKVGNRRGVHLNAIPSNSRYKFDISRLAYLDKRLPNNFLHRLLSEQPLKFRITWKDNVPDLNSLFEEEQAQLTRITKGFENLINQTEAIESEKGINTFGFGFPILIRRDQLDNKLTVAPILIWSLRIRRTKEFNTWEINRSEEDPIYINEVLLNHLQNDSKVEIAQIPSEMLDDGLIDKNELVEICINLLTSINSSVDKNLKQILETKLENVIPIGDRTRYEDLPLSSTNALIEFGGLFSIFEVQKQNIINDYDNLLNLKGLSINLEGLSEHSFQSISSIETDPSQQGILHSLETERNILIQGPPGTGKSQTLTAVLFNALESHKKTIVVCEKRTALEVLHKALCDKGLNYHCVLIKDIVKDRRVVVDSVRDRIDNSSYRGYRYTYSKESLDNLLKTVKKIIASVNKKHKKLGGKILGNKCWTDVVGMLLVEVRSGKEIMDLELDKDLFEYSTNEIQDTIEMLRGAQPLYKDFARYESLSFLNSTKLIGENPFKVEKEIHNDFISYEKALNAISALEIEYKSKYHKLRKLELDNQLQSIDKIREAISRVWEKHKGNADFVDEAKTKSFVYKLKSLVSRSKKVVIQDQGAIKELFTKLSGTCQSSKDVGATDFPGSIREDMVVLDRLLTLLVRITNSFSAKIEKEYESLDILNHQVPEFKFDPLKLITSEVEDLQSRIREAKWTKEDPSGKDLAKFSSQLRKIISQKKAYFENEDDLFVIEFKWFQFYNSLSAKDTKLVNALKGKSDWGRTFLAYYLNSLLVNEATNDLPTNSNDHFSLTEAFTGIEKEQLRYIKEYWYSNQIDLTREFEERNTNLSVENLYNKKSSNRYKRLSLRQIVQYDHNLFTTFFPIILTTPDVCCNLFSGMNQYFDIVMFDEASQLRLEDNLPAVLKGKQIIIAGDEHQMPPSNYFSKVFDGSIEDEDDLEEDNEVVIDRDNILLSCESLLDFATELSFQKKYLDFHYRSRHPYLIDFSNHAFYNKRLKPLPNDFEYVPIKYVQLDGTFSDHTNEVEAEMVLDIIDKNINRLPNGDYPTLGVATFNIAQRNLIKSKILERQRFSRYEEFNSKIQELEENGLFIKNLENIQGDERDVIIISTTYGIGKDGKFSQRFGPINHSKGYKLLNVIITRAKYKIYVCSSVPEPVFMNYKDYLAIEGNNRRAIFYAYLAYCKAVSEGDNDLRLAVLSTLGSNTPGIPKTEHLSEMESPFEEEVYQTLTDHFDKASLSLQFPFAGFRIDIAYLSKLDGIPRIAIECDGAKYHSSREAYLYDWHRQRILEAHGFIFHRIWSTNWWRNPKKETKALVDFIRKVESGDKLERDNSRVPLAFTDEIVKIQNVLNQASVTDKKKSIEVVNTLNLFSATPNKNGVAIQDRVKLKYINNGKDMSIQIVSSSGGKQATKDGIQLISSASPLATSIIGKIVGDIVKVGNLDNFVEILEIAK